LKYTEADGYYHKLDRELKFLNARLIDRRDPVPVSDLARESFQKAFGVTPQDQIDMEEQLRSWKFQCSGDTNVTVDYKIPEWTNLNPYSSEKYCLGEC